ncbi:amidohydrolase family protein [Sphingobium tyrosinilyticum]|uniref:Amidohydrolase family protein n=1 Tax=Sphingobium tyrosinilyticum TaxID=2715436 RepID=A0ABV9F1N6_9SPHN
MISRLLHSGLPKEEAIEPDLPIVDPHHHLWDRSPILHLVDPPQFGWQEVMLRAPRYMIDDFCADLCGGHRVVATVHVEASHAYRPDGPEALRPVGETEFVAAADSTCARGYGKGVNVCAAIVGHADLTLGSGVVPVLQAHVKAGNGRFRGVRHSAAYDPDPAVLGPANEREGLYRTQAFRAGFAQLAPMGLSFDAWLLEPQLADLIDLAAAFPETSIILDHLGTPVGNGSYAGRLQERFPIWKSHIARLAELPNVSLKLGGLGMDYTALPSFMVDPPASSAQLAAEWRPWIEGGIEAFGPDRCMFESNYPSECGAGGYGTIWNAFKRIVTGASAQEKAALFSQTAARVYRIDL